MPWKECSVMDERLRFVARLLEGEAMSEVCRQFGVSRKTGYKIFSRYKEHGLEALSDRCGRPVRYANQLAVPIEQLIVRCTIATSPSPPEVGSACTAKRSTSPPCSPASASESGKSTRAYGSSALCATISDTSTWSRKPCKPSTTRSARGCHPCLRYVPSPMSPGRTMLRLATPRGLEPPTNSLGNCCSILLSYGAAEAGL
jgi:transposase-like protein